MASAGEATPGDAGAGSADGDPPVRMSPEAQAELRIRIAHQVASALQDPRRGRGHDASASDGSWSSILAYAGLSVGGVGVFSGGGGLDFGASVGSCELFAPIHGRKRR